MYDMSGVTIKPALGFSTRSDNQAVQPQKMARDLKFRILEVVRLYYLYIDNLGADQLCGNRTGDLPLCFRTCENQAHIRIITLTS